MKMTNIIRVTAFILTLSVVIISCSDNDTTSQLPFLGHHDISEDQDTIFHTVPSFEYLTQDSTWLYSHEIEDQIWIAKFFFTTCPTICPPMTSAMNELTQDLAQYENEIVFLSFSIDPTKDTPSRMRTYIQEHEITAKNWFFLTGDEDETHDLGVHGFFIHAQADDQAPGGYAHSGNFVLVDKNQHIRGIYDGLDKTERERLIQDFLKLRTYE